MRLLFDTSVLIDHLRGREAARALLVTTVQRGDELWSSVLVRTEILAGMRPEEEATTRQLLDSLRWSDVTPEIADRAGALARRFLASHPGVDTVDYIIAATAEQLSAAIKTLNVKHFPMFDGMQPAYS